MEKSHITLEMLEINFTKFGRFNMQAVLYWFLRWSEMDGG
jgi:hypothetical protein